MNFRCHFWNQCKKLPMGGRLPKNLYLGLNSLYKLKVWNQDQISSISLVNGC